MRKVFIGFVISVCLILFLKTFCIWELNAINTKDPEVQKKYLNDIKNKISVDMTLGKVIEILEKDREYQCDSYSHIDNNGGIRNITFCNKTALCRNWSIELEVVDNKVREIRTKVFDPDFAL